MSKKDKFIEFVKVMMDESYDTWDEDVKESWNDAIEYFNGLQVAGDKGTKAKFTDNGKLVLGYMKENKDLHENLFQAKVIGDNIGVSSRTVSGAMRKLVTDGYVEKIGQNPTVYCITAAGIEVNLEES